MINIKLKFQNRETKKDISLETSKSLIVIYGKNGSGKTTLSRDLKKEECFVFNEDFIFSNVYNVSEDGAVQNVKTKENFSGLWIGEDIVKIRKQISDLISLEKQFKERYQILFEKVNNKLLDHKLVINLNEKLKNIDDDKFILNFKDLTNQAKNYKTDYVYQNNIKNSEDFFEKLKIFQKNDLYNMIFLKIKNNQLLSNLILDSDNKYVEDINNEIVDLMGKNDLIIEIESIYLNDKIDNSNREKIKEWYQLHLDKTKCIFCGNEDISVALEKWKKIFTNKFIQQKQQLLESLTYNIKNLDDNLIQEKSFYEVDKELMEVIIKIKNQVNEIIQKIKENKYEKIVIDFEIKKIELLEINSTINNLANYVIEEDKNILAFYHNALNYMSKIKSKKLQLLNNFMDAKGESIAVKIKEKFEAFGLNKDITITVDKRSTPYKFAFSIKNHNNLSELSDGQKHKLALAIFACHLEENDLSDKTIVIDDPVVALDITSYILFKKYIINDLIINKFKESTKLILLTHDITYLYIQISNIFEKEEMKNITEIYKLNSDSFKKIPIDWIKTDDVSLFRILLDNIQSVNEIYVLNGILNKMFRVILDIKLRFYGISLTNDIGIDHLILDEEQKKVLKNASRHIVKTSRKNNPTFEDIFESFQLLKQSAEILDFKNYITQEHLNKICDVIKSNSNVDSDCMLFEVVKTVNNFLKNDSDQDMKNYIEHTRNSYTKNIIGLSLDDYFE